MKDLSVTEFRHQCLSLLGDLQIVDGDVGLGMVVHHTCSSPVYYNPEMGDGSAIL